MWNKIKPYVVFILIALGIGFLSAFLTMENMDIYDKIKAPPLAPPGFLFPIVWTILYILMGISAARVYKEGINKKISYECPLRIWTFQLVVNFFWSLIFFNMEAFLFAFVWLVILWLLIVLMIKEFKKIDRLSALLQIPYLLWVTFAGYLNFMIFLLN